ncbi:MAG: TrmH family RNA methyltransferase [Erysipelotrichaceae bacterium]|nr:TrmH family RNA methyltransferase [Erysipelotrichaceae bacterium]MDD3808933.1 TrmH family RNA methyltransferase [Erysipelotrichaceae bacterium]
MMKIKSYQKESDYSYTTGVFETIELLKAKPDLVSRIYLASNSYQNKGVAIITKIASQHDIEVVESDKTINRLVKKGNCLALAVFEKYQDELNQANHVVLVNPSDMGNLGTIIRTMSGFSYRDLAIVGSGADTFDPKVLRASMGAIFGLRIKYYDSFEQYRGEFPDNQVFSLMLKGAKNLHQVTPPQQFHSLVFGNESSGLPDVYLEYGQSIFINHTQAIDSLNLAMAVGITLFHFSKVNFMDFVV